MSRDPRRTLVTDREVAILEQQESIIRNAAALDYFPSIPCGECAQEQEIGLSEMYRCLYCGIWYCEVCAEKHFGQTIAAYHGIAK